jgi:hypothetical protein
LPSPELPAADRIGFIESFDDLARLRSVVGQLAQEREHWAGVPMPLDGEQLVIEPSYPFAQALSGNFSPTPEETSDICVRNTFWSQRRRCMVAVLQKGERIAAAQLTGNTVAQELHTMACSDAWGIAQERAALETLGTMLRHFMFKRYLLTGTFIETSARSGVTYIFRRLRPTIAVRNERILCAMCMHPIGYYDGSWAGAMCPTDDVIAHLALMRGDEPMFWRRCNQHGARHSQAGI